ncbi:MAG: hypothetical protein AVDCRST_MAG11-3667 [uncultured Gemmatimonadaceae bacterium]|uniref:Uncharacterized protein n=1 Tax=uncultured Gemmatimonadaceae bacterium TaxID=246130 RepID=A0A6J4M9G5_9BACT|nr:MAG: hypothetical protein AVDCRST_MAG11-3667 [uncultured Gemmatimonadaceae bacterium]
MTAAVASRVSRASGGAAISPGGLTRPAPRTVSRAAAAPAV